VYVAIAESPPQGGRARIPDPDTLETIRRTFEPLRIG
jgi:hypothetical protein